MWWCMRGLSEEERRGMVKGSGVIISRKDLIFSIF